MLDAARAVDPVFRAWTDTNLHPHRRAEEADQPGGANWDANPLNG